MTPFFDPEAIRAFCLRWRVREFSLFGSAVRDDFRPGSDIDVLVSFEPGAPWSLFDMIEMEEELRSAFGRKVDVVELEALRNPFRRRSILDSRKILYAA